MVPSRDEPCAVVGAGRMGAALVRASPLFAGPFGRGFDGDGHAAVLLAVPDARIGDAAACIRPGVLIGHCSGATPLTVLGDRESFGMHPLMTVTREGATFAGAGAAIGGSSERAIAYAAALAAELGMHAFEIHDDDRAAYHAAASIASNFLVTIEDAAEALLATAGGDRTILVPLVRAAVESWAGLGGPAALTGPIARGDEETVARQRASISERIPSFLPLFDALCDATRRLAARR